jgi:nitronate monooxygenase
VAWYDTRVTRALGIRYPIVLAPMAAASTPELAAAVSNAGGLGSIGAAYLPPDDLRAEIRAIRALTDRPFMVNLFAWPEPGPIDERAVAAVLEETAPERDRLGLADPEAVAWDVRAHLEAQLVVVVEERVPVFSFIFGIPELDAVRESGAVVVGTATTPDEARALEAAGVDLVVAQAMEAGGHRGTFARPIDEVLVGGMALVPQVVDAVSVPVLAAGAIMDGRGIAAALALGAEGAWLGTAFLGTPESRASDTVKRVLHDIRPDETTITPVYSGRHARALRTDLIRRLERRGERAPFPFQYDLLRPIHAAAGARGEPELMFLLAGQGAALARDLPAGALVQTLVDETGEALARAAG